MKVCSKCGAEFSDDYNFCEKCGEPLTGDSTDKKNRYKRSASQTR